MMFKSYDNINRCEVLRNFLLKKKQYLNLAGISNEMGYYSRFVAEFVRGDRKTMGFEAINKLENILSDFGLRLGIEEQNIIYVDKIDHIDIKDNIPQEMNIDRIQKTVCDYFNISKEQLYTRKRKQAEIEPRQISMYISREQTKNSLAVIGLRHGGFDHATSLSNHKRISDLRETDKRIRHDIEEIEKRLKNN